MRMKRSMMFAVGICALFLGSLSLARADYASEPRAAPNNRVAPAMKAITERVIQDWPEIPRQTAAAVMEKYGPPDEVTQARLIWHDNGPWKRMEVTREEIPHNFPDRHVDVLAQTINYRVSSDKASQLAAFDGSLLVDRTRGELTARGQDEASNFLALNLANDIAQGRKSADEARAAYAKTVMLSMAGKSSPYMESLAFTEPSGGTGDLDKALLSGTAP